MGRDLIKQTVRFTDRYVGLGTITADILIDARYGRFKIVCDNYVSPFTLVDIVAGNKQICKLKNAECRRIYMIADYESEDYYVEGKSYYERCFDVFEREYILKTKHLSNYRIKETGWLSADELEKLSDYIWRRHYEDSDSEHDNDKTQNHSKVHYKRVRSQLKKYCDFLYVETHVI